MSDDKPGRETSQFDGEKSPQHALLAIFLKVGLPIPGKCKAVKMYR